MTYRRWPNAFVVSFHSMAVLVAVALSFAFANVGSAQVTYDTIGAEYSQSFDSLPNTPVNTSLIASGKEWIDNGQVEAGHTSTIVGWYLYSPNDPGTEDGFNGHQRLRIGNGSAGTGSYWSWGAADSTERALGALPSTAMAGADEQSYIGLRLTNTSGVELNDFTLTFDGEQWRDGTAANTLAFTYSTGQGVNEANWFNHPLGYSAASQLDFAAPVTTNNNALVDGNAAGKTAGITHTLSGVGWAPGEDLWLRWGIAQIGGGTVDDDGLGIDEVKFSAVEGTPGSSPNVVSVQSGPAEDGDTWSNGLPPASGNRYTILDTHTVDLSTNFVGTKLTVANGGTLDLTTDSLNIPWMAVDEGGAITESVSGSFFLGNINAPSLNILDLNADLTFDIDAGAEFGLDVALNGPGDIDFNVNPGSVLYISSAETHDGTIRFNGTGGDVLLLEDQGFHFLEMNSPGARVIYDPTNSLETSSKLTFNQPGTIVHDSVLQRLQGAAVLVVNADVELDLSEQPGQLEKRFLTSAKLEGTANLNVVGTSTAPVGTGLNEFELGSQGDNENEPTGNLLSGPMSGTITMDDFVNVEIRHHLPNAKFVVNENAVLEMGHMKREAAKSVRIGSIEVNSGGILEIGLEKTVGATNGHFAYHLTLDGSGTRDGDLTLHDGAQLNMQINGDPTETTLYDRITADGDVALDGTLRVFVNPDACIGNQTCLANMSYDTGTFTDYVPNEGDTWDIIQTNPDSPPGDYNGDAVVNDLDHAEWMEQFGSTNAAADGNGDGTVNAADYIVYRKNFGATGTSPLITGTFDNIVDDLDGFHFEAIYNVPGKVSIMLVADEGGGGAVPEPTTLALAGFMLCAAGMGSRSRR